MKLSVVIPVYNEVDNIASLVAEIDAACQQAISHKQLTAFEILYVDDGSSDGTVEKIAQLQQQYPVLRCVRHDGNFGQSASTTTGVTMAQYDWILTMDGDGQNDPADLQGLLVELNQYQATNGNLNLMVMGRRRNRDDSAIRKLSSRVGNGVRQWILRDNCPDTGCSLKLFPRAVFLQLPHFDHCHRFLPALFQRSGLAVINIPVNHRPRNAGTSKYGIGNRLWVGIVDLFGVKWLQSRPCQAKVLVND